MVFVAGGALGACICTGAQGCRGWAFAPNGEVQCGQDTGVGHEMQSEDIITCCASSDGMSAVSSSVDDAARGVLLLEDPGSVDSSASRLENRDRGCGSDDGSVFQRCTVLFKSQRSSEM